LKRAEFAFDRFGRAGRRIEKIEIAFG